MAEKDKREGKLGTPTEHLEEAGSKVPTDLTVSPSTPAQREEVVEKVVDDAKKKNEGELMTTMSAHNFAQIYWVLKAIQKNRSQIRLMFDGSIDELNSLTALKTAFDELPHIVLMIEKDNPGIEEMYK